MVTTPTDRFAETLSILKDGSAGVPWTERLAVARELGESIRDEGLDRARLCLIRALAADAKWEVRREVAELLPWVPADEFPRLATQLGEDSNGFVRQTAQRAINRQRHSVSQLGVAKRGADDVDRQLARLQDRYGPSAAKLAQELCDRYSEIVVGSMVHDLRSIVTYFRMHCQSLIDEGHKRRKAAVRVKDDLAFLERTIDDMVTFTLPAPTGRHREKVADLIAAAIDLARENAGVGRDASTVRIETHVPDTLSVVVARHAVVMALANVIKNAIEASQATEVEQPRIDIIVQSHDETVTIGVADHGIGMSDEEKLNCSLVVPGRRNKTKRFSTGYGLPIAARNIAAHGGSLTITSKENEGTTVTMTLPIDADE